ncbi:Bcr/CflA family drug resistance efflux transporter [Amycolatopsis sp. AA4]|uniref:Bcr/CflA family multidrug efflux MFS transporter n=1 Tax=Actinomycetes TaxID=1760 RepID=UPI0001B53A54|nr:MULTISPECIES: Bcr/CflA family multidrug efflux MFS transporter [Actinomycetes]ATY11477.1 Bcr/CflA family drug resistance efflux transporter [Amycolatopsis sp. AA4]
MNETREAPKAGGQLKLVLVLGVLVALGPLSIDMYLPALPDITRELSTTESTIQLTLTGTVLGLGLGQLIAGPLSDAMGRRIPLVAGSLIHVLASLLCLVAPTVELLSAARVLQGLGASAGAVLALAVVRDLYTDRAAAKLLSKLILVMGVSPVLAPTLGSALLAWTHWRGVFVALAAIGLASGIAAALALPETLPPARRQPFRFRATVRSYRSLFTDRSFVGLVLVAGFAMAGLFAFVSGGSFVFQQQYGLDQQQFGLMFGASAVWLIAATQVNARLMNRFEPHQVLLFASVAAAASAAVLLVTALTGFGGMFGVAVPVWAVLFFAGLILPNAPAVALDAHGDNAGTAASLLGAVQFGVGAAVSPVVGLLGNNAAAMATVMFGGLVVSGLVLWLIARPWQGREVERDETVDLRVPVAVD